MLAAPGPELKWTSGDSSQPPSPRLAPRLLGRLAVGGWLTADVLVPQVRVSGDESAEHLDAVGVVQNNNLDSEVS
jgi:hypothetical protein